MWWIGTSTFIVGAFFLGCFNKDIFILATALVMTIGSFLQGYSLGIKELS